jgi:periplasmic protein TonB
MAYADQPALSTRKVVSISLVVLLHALIGYAFITGLAYNVVKKAAEELNVVDVAEEPPPPEQEPPPPPPEQKFEPPPIVAPPPIVQTPVTIAPPIVTAPAPPVITPAAPPAPPPPPAPPRPSQAASPRGNPGQYFSSDNYPPAALRAEAQGRVVAQLQIGTDGRVTGCNVTTSSGNGDLDEATCRISLRRVRFTPAKDQAGNPIASSFTLPVRWVLPQD